MRLRRFRIYTIAYIVSVIIFFINIFGVASTSFLFLSFALSSFFLVFTFETLPKENLDKPQIHFYEKSRLNSYSYAMLIMYITVAFFYYIFTGIIGLHSALVVIVLWPICIVGAQIIYKKTIPNIPYEIAYDYLKSALKINPTYEETKLIRDLLKKLLPIVETTRSKTEINKLQSEFVERGISKEFFEKTFEILEQYVDLTEDKLTSNEVIQIEADKED